MVLAEAPLHGYGLLKAVEQRSRSGVLLDPANLYRVLRRMSGLGWIRRTGEHRGIAEAHVRDRSGWSGGVACGIVTARAVARSGETGGRRRLMSRLHFPVPARAYAAALWLLPPGVRREDADAEAAALGKVIGRVGSRQWRITGVGGGVRLAVVGCVLGLGGTWVAGRFLESRLYEVATTDPVTLGSASLVLLATAALASWLPARRASRTDPIETLKAE